MIKKILAIYLALQWSMCLAKDPFALSDATPPTFTHYTIQYADAIQIEKRINDKKNHFLSKNGYIISDKQSNCLWVYDNDDHIKKISAFISSVDQEQHQVLIKAVIVMIDRQSIQQLGSYFEAGNNNETSSKVHLPLINIESQGLFTIKLTALERNGHATIISEPELITLNRKEASIASGDEIPYQQQNSETSSTSFKKALLQLQVTPTILPNNKVRLLLNIHQDKPSDLMIDGMPAIKTQQLATEVTINNQQTVVLGGIHEQNDSLEHNRVPALHRIPLLGWLFQNKEQQHAQQQLLILITPHILK